MTAALAKGAAASSTGALCYDVDPDSADSQMPDADDGLPSSAMSFGLALVVIDSSIVSVTLPSIASDLHIAPSSAVSIVTIYQLILVMALLL